MMNHDDRNNDNCKNSNNDNAYMIIITIKTY